MEYTLNGNGPFPLSIGSDNLRLEKPGDFNVDILITDPHLLEGDNTVVITARDNAGNQSQETVNVNYTSGNSWPLPYFIDWSSITTIEDIDNLVQVVDGNWGVHGVIKKRVFAGDVK